MRTPTQTISLDVGTRAASRQRVYLCEGDLNGTTLVVNVTEDGKPFDCTGYTPFLMVTVNGLLYRQEGEASGGIVRIPVDESRMGNASGTMSGAYVSLEVDGEVITSTQRFDVELLGSGRDAGMTEAYASDVDEIVSRAEELVSMWEDRLDYNELRNKPMIDDVTIEGSLTLGDLGVTLATNQQILDMFGG